MSRAKVARSLDTDNALYFFFLHLLVATVGEKHKTRGVVRDFVSTFSFCQVLTESFTKLVSLYRVCSVSVGGA